MIITKTVRPLLEEIFYLGARSPILAFKNVEKLLKQYDESDKQNRIAILKHIAKTYHPQEENFPSQIQKMTSSNFIQTCENIHSYTEPKYAELFRLIGRQPDGVHSLVHLRADILKFLPEIESPEYVERMSESLRDLLATWFTTGLLQVERVTWQSPCEIVQRVSEYEAVHRIRNWTDLKRRLGPYRRCFVYTHHMMPNDPLVILHVGLVDNISNSIQTILNRVKSVSDVTEEILHEDPSLINSAIFYSISSTQPGLRGIELGNALIKRCVLQLQAEHPELEKFSSLSPIPDFRKWLLEELHSSSTSIISSEIRSWFHSLFSTSTWHLDETVLGEIRPILMRLCAYYLTQVKHSKTGYARDPVANFHLRNGAVVWRLNWLADRSERGWKQSLSMMVNYRYYTFDKIDRNSIDYIDKQKIQVDEQVSKLL
ncbi:unnamed protein product [Rotaria socialis]|uniref:Malonyl-CoA decarboxylase n=6 Tax=Rotaria TaxID=231623 RepID=A0A820SYT2_9BILA|nr:unnamed protein product [Rotaria socialis]CAF3301830.1 unnamed protein product [Rotaria socialis]CAF3340840.1 unnamed protein product [Rotaria socialis]CAF3362931.1 unnamed protein product [Rotaria socialis]CAF3599466.1 unnamed protein product [Rotaria socialis]